MFGFESENAAGLNCNGLLSQLRLRQKSSVEMTLLATPVLTTTPLLTVEVLYHVWLPIFSSFSGFYECIFWKLRNTNIKHLNLLTKSMDLRFSSINSMMNLKRIMGLLPRCREQKGSKTLSANKPILHVSNVIVSPSTVFKNISTHKGTASTSPLLNAIVNIIVRYATESEGVRRERRLAFWRHDSRRHARKTCRRRPNDRTTAACCGPHSHSITQKHFWQRKRVDQNVTPDCTHWSDGIVYAHLKFEHNNSHVDLRGIFACSIFRTVGNVNILVGLVADVTRVITLTIIIIPASFLRRDRRISVFVFFKKKKKND
ncbi:hypothetical protein AGLY_013108 [Aphis glycines]|uniref:Uncharacterized protein n=1 Tax=Aphis glycines TaxID=307491 RepID=A0A6G0T7X4_APHGL|nr:hypothetical protein AGLY_013108 [Aphis glycines]